MTSNRPPFDRSVTDAELLPAEVQAREDNVRKNFWKKLKRVFRQVPFADDLVAAYFCALDPKTPVKVKGMLLGALAYFILPIDLVPDFLVGVGYSDDAAVLAMVISIVSSHIKPEHRVAATKALEKELPEDNKS